MTDSQMLAAYRHDIHKLRNVVHADATDEFASVPVNDQPAYGADAAASKMSRQPRAEYVLPGHDSFHRRSVVTGRLAHGRQSFSLHHYESSLRDLVTIGDAVEMHRAWLDGRLPALFNEGAQFPYTSLKYHTLLVAALVDCHRSGLELDELGLQEVPTDDPQPFRTVFRFVGDADLPPFRLDIGEHSVGETAKLGHSPTRNFNDVWSRLPTHPFGDGDRRGMVADSTLRHIRAWSTALQYLDDALSLGVADA